MLLHRFIKAALKIFDVCEIAIHKIVHYSCTLIHSEVQHNVGLVVLFVVLWSQLHFKAPLQPLELSQIIQLFSENDFPKFLKVAADFLSKNSGTSCKNSCFYLSSLRSFMAAASSLTFVRYCAKASIIRNTIAVMRSPSFSSISINSEWLLSYNWFSFGFLGWGES